jgi:hypothetical protein
MEGTTTQAARQELANNTDSNKQIAVMVVTSGV